MIPRTVVALGCLLAVAEVRGAAQARPEPVLDVRTRPTAYLGPGRETPPPAGLSELRIAYFGPADPAHDAWGDAWRGAVMAVGEANAEGVGLPFRLASAWSESPWGSGVADLAKLVYAGGVWGVIGGVDGVTTHLAEQIAVKARLSIVSPGGTDPSVNYTNVPWMFTLLPTDDRIATLLAGALVEGGAAWAAITTADRDAAAAWKAVRATDAVKRAQAPIRHLALPTALPDYTPAVAAVAQSDARVALVLAGASDSARIVRALRKGGFGGRIVGGAPFGRRGFAERSGRDAEGVEFPLLFDDERPEAAGFARAFERRWGERPDFLAAHAYDGTRLLIAAVRRAGPNRALIRDALVDLAPWPGVTGQVSWDLTGRNLRPVALGTWRSGRVCAAPARTARVSGRAR